MYGSVLYSCASRLSISCFPSSNLISTLSFSHIAVLNADKSAKTYGVALGSATASLTLKVNVLIYLEGWQTLGATPSAMWGDNYIGAKFDVGMRFETIIHDDTHA